MDKKQKALLVEKIIDPGNLAIAALTFGSLIGEFNLVLLALGIILFITSYFWGIRLKRRWTLWTKLGIQPSY